MKREKERGKGADVWKDIPGYEGIYQASHAGQIRRVRTTGQGVMMQTFKNNIMVIQLTDGKGKRKEQRVAFLVASAWLGPRPRNAVIIHKNRIRTDNCAANLEYIDRRRWGQIIGGDTRRRPVVKKDLTGEIIACYKSARQAARENHYSYQTIIDRCNGRLKRPQKDAIYEWEAGE